MKREDKIKTIEEVMVKLTGMRSNALKDLEVVEAWYNKHEDELNAQERILVRKYMAYLEIMNKCGYDADELLNDTFDEVAKSLEKEFKRENGKFAINIAASIVVAVSPLPVIVKVIVIGALLYKNLVRCLGANEIRSIGEKYDTEL